MTRTLTTAEAQALAEVLARVGGPPSPLLATLRRLGDRLAEEGYRPDDVTPRITGGLHVIG